jgi:hypothetical protein
MGDRANFGIKTSDNDTIFIYLHWGGTDRHEIMANAISYAMVRDGDEGYFTRIFVSRIIAEDWKEETGAGMSINKLSAMGDYNEVVIYDYIDKTISVYQEDWLDGIGGLADYTTEVYDRDEYLAKYGVRKVGGYV